MPTRLRYGQVQISCCTRRRWEFHLSLQRRQPCPGSSSASPGLSWRKSCKRGNVERHRIAGVPGWEHGEPSAPDPAEGPMCSLCWRGDRKENSAVIWDLGGLLSHFSPSSPHMAFLCSKQICHSLNDPKGYPDWVPAATWLRFILPS